MTSTAVQNVLNKLPSAKSAGLGKWQALCPVHEADGNGHKPSLSIGQGDGGKVLLNCKAGCATADVVKALGLTMADLFADRPKAPTTYRPATRTATKARTSKTYPHFCTAWADVEHRVGGWAVGVWRYPHDALRIVRFDLPTVDGEKQEKTFRPFHQTPDGWVCIDPTGPLPLYRGDELPDTGPIVVCEGCKCVDAARSIGLAAVTSAHGAGSADKADWTLLRGRKIIILADNDSGGLKYAQEVGAILVVLGCEVRIVRLPGLPPKGDIADLLGPDGAWDAKTAEECHAAILALAEKVTPWTPGPADTLDAAPDAEAEHGVFVRLSDVAPQPINWLWTGRFALGKLAVLAGNAGVGKSCLTLDLAARVTRGDGWPDCPASLSGPGGVVLLSAEDDLADTIRPRLDAAGADVSRVLALTTVKHYDPERKREVFASFNLATDLSILESGIAQVENCRLVIIDVISAYLGGTDSHNNSEVRGLLAPLAELAARHHVAIVAVSHLNKGAGDALARVMGSIAFVAAARHVYAVAKDHDDPSLRLCLPVKNNLGVDNTGLAYRLIPVAGGVPRVVWEPGTVSVSADEAVAPVDQRRGPEAEGQEEARAWLMDFLANGPRAAVDCYAEATRVGISRATLLRAKPAAGVLAGKDGYAGPWTWRLPGYENVVLPMKTEGTHEGTQTPLF